MLCDFRVSDVFFAISLLTAFSGTNVEAAQELIADSGLRIMTSDDLDEAAVKVVRVADIVSMAEEAHVDVKFELPL